MRIATLALLALLSPPSLGAAGDGGDGVHTVVEGWPALPPELELGEAAGVGVDSHGHVWVFHRGASQPIVCLDAGSGELLHSFGEGIFVNAHGLAVDSEDNVWVTDTRLHQVLSFTHQGELRLVVGEKSRPGQGGEQFDQPTDVAIAPSGEFYVTDGYGNSRVAKFAPDGTLLTEWGSKGAEPGQFDLPHGITLDPEGRVYVADRSNLRIQVFDSDGSFLAQWRSEQLGRPWGLEVAPDGYLYVIDGGDMRPEPPHRAQLLKLDLEGRILERWSGYGSAPGVLAWGHDLAVARDGAVYTVEVRHNNRVQKFVTP